MTHDPLCPMLKPCNYPAHDAMNYCDICGQRCHCDLIAKVRDDERARHRERDCVHVDYCRDAACGGCYEHGYAE